MNKKNIIITGVIAISVFILLFSYKDVFRNDKKEVPIIATTKMTLNMPVLDLPLRYFTDDSIAWGSVNTSRNSDDKNTWEYAAVDGGDAYQSFPTKTITLSSDDFSNNIEQLPPIKSMEQIIEQDVEIDAPWQWLYKDQIKEYGDLATRFLPDESIDAKKFDVDKDGKDEMIIFLCGVGGNHCPHHIIVVKDQKIIFSVSAGLTGLNISKTETGNGFYVHWVPAEGKWDDRGLCCSLGYIKTRFVYEGGKFIPVYEQEVLYMQIKNTE